MKRCWFGLGLLIFLLAGGLLVTWAMDASYRQLADKLEQAEGAALAEDWTGAEELLGSAREIWQEKWRFSAAFADHEPMEEIDGLFAQGKIYLRCRDPEALAAVCGELAQRTKAMGEAHWLTWWNLL